MGLPMIVRDNDRTGGALFRLILLALLIGQMFVFYDTATRTVPRINLYLLLNIAMILAAFIPSLPLTRCLWPATWVLGALLRADWATRRTTSDVYWATSQGVDFLLHGMNPYAHPPTWVYQQAHVTGVYPTYAYFPVSLLAEAPFSLLGNVRLGLAVADLCTALLLLLIARRRLGAWPARGVAAAWLLFLPGFAVPLRLGILDFLLIAWIALAVWLAVTGRPVGSAVAAALAAATKQYAVVFALPWLVLLARPLVISVYARWRDGAPLRRAVAALPRRTWLPPVLLIALPAMLILAFALASPQAFWDATIVHHSRLTPTPMLGTPQWNESIAAQLVALGWLPIDTARAVALAALAATLAVLMPLMVARVRDIAAALRWAALLSAVWFALSGMEVQFYYWRLPLVLAVLAFIVPDGALPPVIGNGRAERRAARAERESLRVPADASSLRTPDDRLRPERGSARTQPLPFPVARTPRD